MSVKLALALITLLAVLSDSLLHPFYPQYFRDVFQVSDPRHVGYFIAAAHLTVLLCFPLWALVSRKVDVRWLLVVTQLGAGILSLLAAELHSLVWFWLSCMGMFAFKASYLLIYPYFMSLERKENHVGTISVLAFVVYFAHIVAGLVGGALFEWVNPRSLFHVMAAGDALQILVCLYLLWSPRFAEPPAEQGESEELEAAPPGFLARLGLIMFLMYFSAYLTEPFFAEYWERISALDSQALSGAVFAIPGLAALVALAFNLKRGRHGSAFSGVIPAIAIGVLSLFLQASERVPVVLAGRFVYGFVLFQAMVRLDSLLFQYAAPGSYALEFSKANLFQGLGVLFASLSAGSVVSSFGVPFTFVLAGGGFLIALALFAALLRPSLGVAEACDGVLESSHEA